MLSSVHGHACDGGAAHSSMPAGLSLAGAAVDVESIGASAAKGAIKEDSIVTSSSVFNAVGGLGERCCS